MFTIPDNKSDEEGPEENYQLTNGFLDSDSDSNSVDSEVEDNDDELWELI